VLLLSLGAVLRSVSRRAASSEARTPPARSGSLGGRARAALDRSRPLLQASGRLIWGLGALETLLVTALSWLCYCGTVAWLAQGLGLSVPLSGIAFATALSALGAALPISFQGVGTRDGIFALLLAPHGVGTTGAVTLSLSLLALFYAVTLPIGALGLLWRRAQRARERHPPAVVRP
jgi:uncharacterized membrane protein YbhN (UPF0104 family)